MPPALPFPLAAALPPQPAPHCADTSLHARLRRETGAAHAALEDALDLLGAPPERRRFVVLLQRWLAFHRAWEPALAAWLPPALTEPRERIGLLVNDLRALGAAETEHPGSPRCPGAADLCASRAGALGSLYVLEGSTLGGRVIAQALREATWLPPGGLRSFDPYGAECGLRWHETLAFIEAGDEPAPAVVEGALQTFGLLHRWLVPSPLG